MSDHKATLNINNATLELPIKHGTLGSDVIEIANLREQNVFTFDPGFVATASCESKITFIDGENGVLLHGGYTIQDLAERSDYLEVCYLLLHNELPNQSQKSQFVDQIKSHSYVEEHIAKILATVPVDYHPMTMLMMVVSALAGEHNEVKINDPAYRLNVAYQLIAKMPILVAMIYKHRQGQAWIPPKLSFDYAENFLHMMFAAFAEDGKPNPAFTKAIDRILVLHADHEQNASTSTVRLAGSTSANPFACIVAAIASLWGPAHGGANEAVINMLEEIAHTDKIPEYIARAKDKNDPFRLMGFGHRVYKNFDPRATIMRETCYEVLNALGDKDNPLLKVALELEKIALQDPYFVEKKLYPNVDFYSGIILKALNIPTEMFTVMFALSRTVGWISNWKEMWETPNQKISRPRQLYIGPLQRKFVAIEDR